jgi:hypothetical protein
MVMIMSALVGEMAVWRAGKGSWASGRGVLQEAPMGEGEGGHDDDDDDEEEEEEEEEDDPTCPGATWGRGGAVEGARDG